MGVRFAPFFAYVINSEKITHERFKELESDVTLLKQKVNKIEELTDSNKLNPKQGIFFDGQIFDAYVFINDILKDTKKEVLLIDNYIDETVLTLFSKYTTLKFTIVTQKISNQLKLDIEKYNSQYKNLTIKTSSSYHDRFLIVDKEKAYHIGASLKDLGKKVFGFNLISIELLKDIEELKR